MTDVPLRFEKLSRFDRIAEPCTAAVPFAEGVLREPSSVTVRGGNGPVPTQVHVTATWPEGSVKWLLVHFLADLPGNAGRTFTLSTGDAPPPSPDEPVTVQATDEGMLMRTGTFSAVLQPSGGRGLIRRIALDGTVFDDVFDGPTVTADQGASWSASVGPSGWEVLEAGPVRAVLEARGKHTGPKGASWLDFIFRITAFAGKPWVQMDYRVIHREDAAELTLKSVRFSLTPECADETKVRTALATSNYRSRIRRSDSGEKLHQLIDADHLIYESNEQVPETLYGTFWADWSDPAAGGVCVAVRQAYQNFPKALTVDGFGLHACIVPPGHGLTLLRGMAKMHRMLLHVHGPDTSVQDLNVRCLQFEMPDRPVLAEDVYRAAEVFEDVWVDRRVGRVERYLVDLADHRTRGYGMLHWGDGPDAGYTEQGRGRGELVWTNNEYDFPHAAMLLYACTGERRMLDYLLVAAEHWMDVDVCHHDDDPLRLGGQIVHSARHATKGVTVSHEWVEGLLDYYHQTGERFALETALDIGENVLRHLARPEMHALAGTQARETGWALRTLTALHHETHDGKWLEPAERIVDQFEAWHNEFGAWLAPYTDHSLVRVPFMIAIAVNSLALFHRVRPQERIARMIVEAVRDMIEHCRIADGRFHYKELPSLQRRGAGMLTLAALAHAWEVSGDVSFLEAGLPTFDEVLSGGRGHGYSGPKFAAGDAVIWPDGPGPKAFAAGFGAIMPFYRAASKAGLLDDRA